MAEICYFPSRKDCPLPSMKKENEHAQPHANDYPGCSTRMGAPTASILPLGFGAGASVQERPLLRRVPRFRREETSFVRRGITDAFAGTLSVGNNFQPHSGDNRARHTHWPGRQRNHQPNYQSMGKRLSGKVLQPHTRTHPKGDVMRR